MVAGLTEAAVPTAPCITDARRLIVKVGSALLVDGDGALRREWLSTLVADIAAAHQQGRAVAVVSSGAIALGARRLGLTKGGRGSLDDAQAAAAVGQIALAGAWADLFSAHGITAAQMLLTPGDLEERRRYLNASATLDRLFALGVVPVINENDSVATAEIRFGDNDRLAARVAQAAGADAVLLLSDVDGLYTADPARDPGARHLPVVTHIDADIAAMADGGSASGMGSGGMASKLEAARIATRAGIALTIASGRHDHPLARLNAGGIGTLFLPDAKAPARKAWLGGRLKSAGTLHIDAGAAHALASGNSLLPAGVTAISGDFARGDVVDICAADGRVLARGLTQYDAADAARILGQRSNELAAILGHAPRAALVHRDHMVML